MKWLPVFQKVWNDTAYNIRHGGKEVEQIQIWKNQHKPPYMDSEEKDLNEEKILYAVKNMSFIGLQNMACLGLLFMGKFLSPAEICRYIEELEVKK